jgi:hypothetical protein
MDGKKILSAHDDFVTISTPLVKAASHASRFGLDKGCGNGFGQL